MLVFKNRPPVHQRNFQRPDAKQLLEGLGCNQSAVSALNCDDFGGFPSVGGIGKTAVRMPGPALYVAQFAAVRICQEIDEQKVSDVMAEQVARLQQECR